MSGCPFTPTYSHLALFSSLDRHPQVISLLSSRLLAGAKRVLSVKEHRLHTSSLWQHLFLYSTERDLCFLKSWLCWFRLPHLSRFQFRVWSISIKDILLFRACLSDQTISSRKVSNEASSSPGDQRQLITRFSARSKANEAWIPANLRHSFSTLSVNC